MKELRADASAPVAASPAECTEFLSAVDRYPTWHPRLIRQAEVLERAGDGTPVLANATVELALGPIVHDVHLVITVAVERGERVTLTRVPYEPSDEERFELAWRVEADQSTVLHLELMADVEIPRFVPVGPLGGKVAQGFVDAASRALGASSPSASASSS